MSSYSFSHQFYQHWMQAPEPIRAAIVQELTDITTLLQTDTPFEEFVFSTHDLDAHLDDLYDDYEKQQAAAKKIADEQAALRLAAEEQRLAEEKKAAETEARAKAEAQRQEEAKQQQEAKRQTESKKVQQEKDAAALEAIDRVDDVARNTAAEKAGDEVSRESKAADSAQDSTRSSTTAHTINNIAGHATETTIVKPKKGAAIDLSLKDPVLSAAHEDLIQELEMHVDDYLSEQMMQISEDLKSWLRAEVSRQLTDMKTEDQAADSNAKES